MATLQVHYSRDGERHEIKTGNAALGDIVINTAGIPAEERNGTAKQFLGSAALYCYCAALTTAMEARGLAYKNLRGTATLTAGNNENHQSRILSIEVEVHVEIDEDDLDTFDRIQKIMKSGCLVTNSIHDGIDMSYKLIADVED